MDRERHADADITAAFQAVVDEPHALVSAVNGDGLFVPMPPSFRIERSRILHARSALDFIVGDDRLTVIEGWHRAKDTGMSETDVHLAASPDETTTLYLFDLTHLHGCYFCAVVVPEGAQDFRPDAAEGMASRVTWATKTDRGVIADVDPGIERMLGWTPAEMATRTSTDFIHPDDHELAIDNWLTMMGSGTDGQRVRLRHRHKDGHYIWLEVVNENYLDDPTHPHVRAQMIDISDEMAAQEALREREQLLNRLAEALPSGLLHVLADRSVVYTNERLHEIVAVPRAETLEEQLRTILRDDWPLLEDAFARAMGGDDVDVELRLRLPGANDLRLCHLSMRSLSEPDGTVNAAIVSVADVTESASMREELRHQATYDALTGCYNRAAVMQILDEHIALGEPLATIFLDLDRFKTINDELGHAAGDELLVAAAERLRQSVRAGDIVGRIGGDEFLVVCRDVATRDTAKDLAELVAAAMSHEVALAAGTVDLRASVGVAWSSGEVNNADELVAHADLAMYESKRRGVGQAVTFTPGLRPSHNARLDEELALHHALDRGELLVHFQPIVQMRSGAPVGYESLVRWSRGDDGAAASEFIDIAEDTGLIHQLGARARSDMVHTAAQNAGRIDPCSRWFCNVSAHELQMPGIVDSISSVVDAVGLTRESLVIEFKCGLPTDAVTPASRALGELRHAGFELAIDDFGEGWAPLEVLRSAQPTWLKLAPSLASACPTDGVAAGVVHATLDLVGRIGATPIAKGIETPEQRDAMLALGVELGQGHLFAPAAPLSALLAEG